MRVEGIVKKDMGETCEVIVRRKTACGDNCASCGGACKMKFQQVVAKNPIGAKAGDSVIMEMESSKVLFSAFLVYILTLLIFVVTFYTIQKFFASNKIALVTALVPTALVFLFTVRYDRRHKLDLLPIIVKID